MDTIKGIDAIRLAQEVSKLPDGCFTIAFFKCDLSTNEVSDKLSIRKDCKTRKQLPTECWTADSDEYFLFQDKDGNPKTAHRVLIRFMGFPPTFQLRKVQWFK